MVQDRNSLERPCELAEDLLMTLADMQMVVREIHDEWIASIDDRSNPHECEMCAEHLKGKQSE